MMSFCCVLCCCAPREKEKGRKNQALVNEKTRGLRGLGGSAVLLFFFSFLFRKRECNRREEGREDDRGEGRKISGFLGEERESRSRQLGLESWVEFDDKGLP